MKSLTKKLGIATLGFSLLFGTPGCSNAENPQENNDSNFFSSLFEKKKEKTEEEKERNKRRQKYLKEDFDINELNEEEFWEFLRGSWVSGELKEVLPYKKN